jgi:hypothetical protein
MWVFTTVTWVHLFCFPVGLVHMCVMFPDCSGCVLMANANESFSLLFPSSSVRMVMQMNLV